LKFQLAHNRKLEIFSLRNSTLDFSTNNILHTFALRDSRLNVVWKFWNAVSSGFSSCSFKIWTTTRGL